MLFPLKTGSFERGRRIEEMSEKVLRTGVERKKGWLYYLDKNLNVYRAKMVRGGEKKKKGEHPELVIKTD